MVFSIFADTGNISTAISEQSIASAGNPALTSYHPYSAVPPKPQATSDLLSASIDLPILDISHKPNHITDGLL